MPESDERPRLHEVFLIARSVVDELAKRAALVNKISIHSIVDVIEQQVKPVGIERITLIARNWRSQQFHSACFRFERAAEIHYSVHSNLCWRRFAVCKEAMHLLIDYDERHFTTDVPELIEKLIVGEVPMDTHSPVSSEFLGEIAALEVLLPWKLRPVLEQMRDAGETDNQIAVQCRIPEKYVTAMLHGAYGKSSRHVNQKLDGSK